MDSSQLNKESLEEVGGQTKTFYLDCDAELGDENLGSRKVLYYDVDSKMLKEKGVMKQSENSKAERIVLKCFNCDGDHFINNCKVEKNYRRIAESRKRFNTENRIKKTGKKVFGGRYHRSNAPNEETMKVGTLSDELRESMGLRWNELPVHIYNMRKFGYPPGWEECAIEKISVLKIYDSATPSSTRSTQPEKTIINPDSIHVYPGFNSPVVYPFYDDYNYWRVPPYSDGYSRENYILQLQNRLNSEDESYRFTDETMNSDVSNDILGKNEASKDYSKYDHETSDQNFIYERHSGLHYNTRESDPYSHYTGMTTNEYQHAFLHESTTKRRGQKDHLRRCRGKPVRTTEFSHRGKFRRGKRYNPYNNQPVERAPKPGQDDNANYFPDDENLKDCVNDDSITEIGGKRSNAKESKDEVVVITVTNTLCDGDVQTDKTCEKATTNINCKDEVKHGQNNTNITNLTSNSSNDDDDVVVIACVDYSKKPPKFSPENIVNLSQFDLQSCIQVLKANFESTDYEHGDQIRYGEVPSLSKFSIGISQLPLEPPREESGRLKSVIDKIRARNKR